MDAAHPDPVSRALLPLLPRRPLIHAWASLILGGLAGRALDDNAQAKKKHKRRKRKRKKHKTLQIRADAACPGATGHGSSANGNARYAQTFTAITSGPLVQVEVRIGKAEGTLGDYILRLGAVDAAHVPTNTVLATASVPNDAVPVGVGPLTFSFPNPYSLVAGVQYALIITRPGSTILQVNGHANDTCAGSAFFSNDQNDPFEEGGLADLIFATFVQS